MVLRASGPTVAGRSRSTQGVRVARSPYGPSSRHRNFTPIRATTSETEIAEVPKGSAVIAGLFSGLARLSTTGTVQLKAKKEDKKVPTTKDGRDDSVVFVAGATGRTGARVVRELLDSGFTVRAGARDVEAASAALSVAVTYGIIKPEQVKRVTVVPFDVAKVDGFAEAIGNANKIVCAVGAPEDQALNFSAPKKIDGEGSIALINKASELGVAQFVIVTSLGTGKLGWPSGVLNLFGGVLIWKREAEKVLESSGMAYTIVRPGGMERPTDDYKRTHNLVLKSRDTTFGGQVSRLQVAELVAACCRSPAAAENKVVEVVAETTAPLRTFEELLVELPQDISREAQLANKETVDAARAELTAAQLKASQAAAVLLEADKRVAELSARLKEAKTTEATVKKEVGPLLKQVKPLETQLADARKKAERSALLEQAAKLVLERARKKAGAGELLSDNERAAIVDEVLNPRPVAVEPVPAQKGSTNIFGFFGKKPEPAGPTEEEKAAAAEAEVAAAEAAAAEAAAAAAKAKIPASLFAGLFAAKPTPVEPEPAVAVEAEAAVVKVEVASAAKVKAPAPLFGGFFTPKSAPSTPAPEVEKDELVVVAASKPAPPAAAPAAPEVVVEELKPRFNVGSFFGNLVKRAEEQQLADASPEPVLAVAAAAGPVEAQTPLQPVLAVAAAAVPVQAQAPPPPPPKRAAPKPAPAAANPMDDERRRRAVEAAKAQLAASLGNSAPTSEPPAPPKVKEPEAVKVEEAISKPAPAPMAPQEAVPVVVEAAPKPVKKDSEFDPEDAARRKAEAKAWIEAWKSGGVRSQSQNGASTVAEPAAAAAKAEVSEEVVANPVSGFFSKLFN